MIPTRRLLLPLLVLALAGCDTSGEIVFEPELETAEGFESGMGEWSFASANVQSGLANVEVALGSGAEGAYAAYFTLDGNGGGTLWIQRSFIVTPNVDYEVELDWSIGSSDTAEREPWSVVSGSFGSAPTASGLAVQGPTPYGTAGAQVRWTRVQASHVARSGSDGRLWVAIGFRAMTDGTRIYDVDDIRITVQAVGVGA